MTKQCSCGNLFTIKKTVVNLQIRINVFRKVLFDSHVQLLSAMMLRNALVALLKKKLNEVSSLSSNLLTFQPKDSFFEPRFATLKSMPLGFDAKHFFASVNEKESKMAQYGRVIIKIN